MDWHEELLKRGFCLLESSTRTYGNGKITGSLVFEKPDKNSMTKDGIIVDKKDKDANEIFCPFIQADDDRKPNYNYQTVRLRNEKDLDEYLYY
jgi:hypothetical protein